MGLAPPSLVDSARIRESWAGPINFNYSLAGIFGPSEYFSERNSMFIFLDCDVVSRAPQHK